MVAAGTAAVVAVNVAELAPAGTTTDAGTVTAALSRKRATTAPPAGAGPFKVMVPIDEFVPTRDPGESVNWETTGGLTVRLAD
jgi:hypothetical protein